MKSRVAEPVAETSPALVVRSWGAWRPVTIGAEALVLAGLALWLRYRPLGITSLWLDDAWVADGSRVATIGDTIRTGLTSPGFSLIYRGWASVFGYTATTAQLLALLFAVMTPVAIFLVALERRLPVFAAFVAGLLVATAPAHIEFSTHLKQYTAEALGATFVLWGAWRVLDRATDGRRWAVLTGIAIVASLTSSVGAVTAVSALAVCSAAAFLARPRRIRPALVSTAVYGLVAGAWALIAVKPNLSSSHLTEYWRRKFLDGDGFAGGLVDRLEDVAHGFQSLEALLVLAVLLIAAAFVLVRRTLLGALLVAPTVVAIALCALRIAPLGTGRTDIYLFPSYALLIAVAIGELVSLVPGREWVIGVAAITAAVLIALNATAAGTDAYPHENLTPLVHMVERRRQPGDAVVVYPKAQFAYGLATRYQIATRPDPTSGPGWIVQVRGPNVVVLRPELVRWERQLARLTHASKRIWLVGSHLHWPAPDWGALLGLLLDRGYQISEVHQRPDAHLVLMSPEGQSAASPG
jgi:hypothetical protein